MRGSASRSVYRSGVAAGSRKPLTIARVPDPDGEVAHLPARPERPQQTDGLGESVEEPAEPGGTLLAEHVAELRVVAPGLGLELETCVAHQRRIRAIPTPWPVARASAPAAG